MVQKEKLIEYVGEIWAETLDARLFSKEWIHKKTGNRYFSDKIVFDATNATEGRLMMVYQKTDPDGNTYCRELKEFLNKFMLIPKI